MDIYSIAILLLIAAILFYTGSYFIIRSCHSERNPKLIFHGRNPPHQRSLQLLKDENSQHQKISEARKFRSNHKTALTPKTKGNEEEQRKSTAKYSTPNSQTPSMRVLDKISRQILNKTREKIRYQFSSNVSLSGVQLKDLTLDSGTPIQGMIISTLGSGSTYLGQLLNSIPGTYYHFEPLSSYGVGHIKPAEVNKSLDTIRSLLNCDFEGLSDYFRFAKKNVSFFRQNKKLWEHCETNKYLCDHVPFMSQFCKLFPIQIMKVVRLRLEFVAKILDDTSLNVKMILLVRHPWKVMHSRKRHEICRDTPDCTNATIVCSEMFRTRLAVEQMRMQYPGRIMILRYETLAKNPEVVFRRLLKFLKINTKDSFNVSIQSYKKLGPVDLTVVPSKSNSFSSIHDFQMVCRKAMQVWGYKIIKQ